MKYIVQKRCLDKEWRPIFENNKFDSIKDSLSIMNFFVTWDPAGEFRIMQEE